MSRYRKVKRKVKCKMTYDRKLMRNGNGWALSLNSTVLKFLDVNPEEDMVQYTIENETLKITKSKKHIEKE